MIYGTIYGFFPVKIEDGSNGCEALNTWQWKYFGWLFNLMTFAISIFASFLNIDNLPFVVKVKK